MPAPTFPILSAACRACSRASPKPVRRSRRKERGPALAVTTGLPALRRGTWLNIRTGRSIRWRAADEYRRRKVTTRLRPTALTEVGEHEWEVAGRARKSHVGANDGSRAHFWQPQRRFSLGPQRWRYAH